MIRTIQKRRSNFSYKLISFFVCLSFTLTLITPPQSYAQNITTFNLPAPGAMVNPSPGFLPPIIRGLTIHPDNPLQFDFLVDQGETPLTSHELKEESRKLIKYFLASLTVPETDMWVNLSPYEKDRIIPEEFGQTEMGRDLLSQDYILKQLTASLIYPEDELGKKFWDKVYKKAYERFGTTDIPVDTFNKVWIVPDRAFVYEHGYSAFVADSHLKVMLEEDYLALSESTKDVRGKTKDETSDVSRLTSNIIKEIILPEIEKEINTGENFAQLRQIYNSMILATWYKQNLKETLLGQVYVDQNKVKGIDLADKQDKEKIYKQYLAAYKKGVYNYIKEDYDAATRQVIPRKYFSGGFSFDAAMLTSGSIAAAPNPAVALANVQSIAASRGNVFSVTALNVEETAEGSAQAAVAGLETQAALADAAVLSNAERARLNGIQSDLMSLEGKLSFGGGGRKYTATQQDLTQKRQFLQGLQEQPLNDQDTQVIRRLLSQVNERLQDYDAALLSVAKGIPALSTFVSDFVQRFSDIVTIKEDGVEIIGGPEALVGNRRLFDLERELTENPTKDVQEAAFWVASAITNARGIPVTSSQNWYAARSRLIKEGKLGEGKEVKPFVMPAENQRTGGMLQTVGFYQDLEELNAIGIVELAASETVYSGLRNNQHFSASTQLAHAYVGATSPIILQADHRQLGAAKMFALDENKVPTDKLKEVKAAWGNMTMDEKETSGYIDLAARQAEIERYDAEAFDAMAARIFNIDMDISTIVDQVALKKLYEDTMESEGTEKNPLGLSRLMTEVHRRSEIEKQSLEEVGDWILAMSDRELRDWIDPERTERYRAINKHTAKFTAERIVALRRQQEKMRQQGLLAPNLTILIGAEERHTDWPELKTRPSEVEGTIALMELIGEHLFQEAEAFKAEFGVDLVDYDKMSYQNGTAHGIKGRTANTIPFLIHERILNILGVQHGASTLTLDQFKRLTEHLVGEVHLATQIQIEGLRTLAEEVPEINDFMWDMMGLLMYPTDTEGLLYSGEEIITDRVLAYAAVIAKSQGATSAQVNDDEWLLDYTSDWLLGYAKRTHGKNKKYGVGKEIKFTVDGEERTVKQSPWRHYVDEVASALNLDPDKNIEHRREIVRLMVTDEEVPAHVQSSLKDLVKFLNLPLLPYFLRLPKELEQKVISAQRAWRGPVYRDLGVQDTADIFAKYSTIEMAPLPQKPHALADTARPGQRPGEASAPEGDRAMTGALAEAQLAPRIAYDSRGRETVEVDLIIGDLKTTGDVPAGASKGEAEAKTVGVKQAMKNITQKILPALQKAKLDLNIHDDLVKADQIMEELGGNNFADIGADATVPVTRALWQMAANLKGLELGEYIRKYEPDAVYNRERGFFLFNVYNGGLHALKEGETLGIDRIDTQEIMVAIRDSSYAEALQMGDAIDRALREVLWEKYEQGTITRADEAGFSVKGLGSTDIAIEHVLETIQRAGFEPGRDVKLSLDMATSTFYQRGVYNFQNQKRLASSMSSYYMGLARRHPGIFYSIEDGLDENDWGNWPAHTRTMSKEGIITIGDDLLVTQEERLARAIAQKSVTAILIKVNQNGTMSGTLRAIKQAKKNGILSVVSHRSGETMDTTIADLAWAINADLKTGAPQANAEGDDFGPGGAYAGQPLVRRAKYERVVKLEQLADAAMVAPRNIKEIIELSMRAGREAHDAILGDKKDHVTTANAAARDAYWRTFNRLLGANMAHPTDAAMVGDTKLIFREDAELGDLEEAYPQVFTPRAIELLKRFAPVTEKILALREKEAREDLRRFENGEDLQFLPVENPDGSDYVVPGMDVSVKQARAGDYEGAPVPEILAREGATITGPTTRDGQPLEISLRSIAYQWLSGAEFVLEDGEDSLGQTHNMSIDGIRNLTMALKNDPIFMKVVEEVAQSMIDKGKRPADWDWRKLIDEHYTVPLYRIRGRHLDDRHLKYTTADGRTIPIAASVVDIILYYVNNYEALLDAGLPLAIYYPKIQSAEEAALIRKEVLAPLEDELEYNGKKLSEIPLEDGKTGGILKVAVLIENVKAAMQMAEIRAAFGRHIVLLNTARWDYLATVIKAKDHDPDWVPDDFRLITMTYPFMHTFEDALWRVVNTPDRNGNTILFEDGMEVQIPTIPDDIPQEEKDRYIATFMAKARANKVRGAKAGAPRGWVAHPDMVEVVATPFKERYGEGKAPTVGQTQNLEGVQWTPLTYTPEDAKAFFNLADNQEITVQGVREDISVYLQYKLNVLTGQGAASIKPADFFSDPSIPYLMEDRATDEGRSAGTRKKTKVMARFTHDDESAGVKAGDPLTRELFLRLKQEELDKLLAAPDRIVHDYAKPTILPIANKALEKFVLAWVDDGIKLPWSVDLETAVLDVTDPDTAEKLMDQSIEHFAKSGSIDRMTANPQFTPADAAMTEEEKPVIGPAEVALDNAAYEELDVDEAIYETVPKRTDPARQPSGVVNNQQAYEGLDVPGAITETPPLRTDPKRAKPAPAADEKESDFDAALLTISDREKANLARWDRQRVEQGRFFERLHTARQTALQQLPVQDDLKVVNFVSQKYNEAQRSQFRTGTTTATFGVTNNVMAEAVARSKTAWKTAKITDQHLAEILGVDASRNVIDTLRKDLIQQGYLDQNGLVTEAFLSLEIRTADDFTLDGKYDIQPLMIYQGLLNIVWKRILGFYNGGWAAIMKLGETDQAKQMFDYLVKLAAEMSTMLMSHARSQEAVISLMGLSNEEEMAFRASPKYVDFYIPIFMDIDHGHRMPSQLIAFDLRVGKDGLLVAAVHLEDQCQKKCGHMSGKSLVTTKDWLQAINLVRQQLDVMNLDVNIVHRTDAESAEWISGKDDGRDQRFILGVTNQIATEGAREALLEDAEKEIRKKVQLQIGQGKIAARDAESIVQESLDATRGLIDFMIDEDGQIKPYLKVINYAREEKNLEGSSLAVIHYVWKKAARLKTIDEVVEGEIRKAEADGQSLGMSVAEWHAFLATIPQTNSTDFFQEVRNKARELGIIIHSQDGWRTLREFSPATLKNGNIHVVWDVDVPRNHDDSNTFWMIKSGVPMAVARNMYALARGDQPWMEQKHPSIIETIVWAMALDQAAVDILLEKDFWGLLDDSDHRELKEQRGQDGRNIEEILRQYLVERRINPGNAFLEARDSLIRLGVDTKTAVLLIDAVSKPKANNTSPSFRWPEATVGISREKLQGMIDEIMKFLPSLRFVGRTAEDFDAIRTATFASFGIEVASVLDNEIPMSDEFKQNFLKVQGRDVEFQFSTYFGDVLNHVMTQVFVEGTHDREEEQEIREILQKMYSGGYLEDGMLSISRLQALGYLIENKFTENTQNFAGMVLDAMREAFGRGEQTTLMPMGMAGDTQRAEVSVVGPQKETVPHIPELFALNLRDSHGLKVQKVETFRLQGNLSVDQVLGNVANRGALQTSISGALGSILLAGGGDEVRNVADVNAAHLSEESLLHFTQTHDNQAVAIIVDEGNGRLPVRRIYYSGYTDNGGYRDFADVDAYRTAIEELREEARLDISFIIDDALENKEGITDRRALKEPTNSWSTVALHGDTGPGGRIRFTLDNKWRKAGITFNAPNKADVHPLDLPSEALPKIAQARGIDASDAEAYADFLSHVRISIRGPERDLPDFDRRLAGHPHRELIADANRLKEQYPGLQVVISPEGELVPGVASVLGLDLDGYLMVTFGQKGVSEETQVEIASSLVPKEQGQVVDFFVSPSATESLLSVETAHQYTDAERKSFADFGFPEDALTTVRTTQDITGKGVVAMTSVTGATEQYFGSTLADLLHRVTFDDESATVTTNTLLVAQDGSVFVVRTTLESKDIEATRTSIKTASPEAAAYVKGDAALVAKPVGGIDLNAANLDLQIKRDGKGVPLPVNLQPLETMNIQGFVPIIINIAPVQNLPMLLGLSTQDFEDETADSAPAVSPFGPAAYFEERRKARELELSKI